MLDVNKRLNSDQCLNIKLQFKYENYVGMKQLTGAEL